MSLASVRLLMPIVVVLSACRSESTIDTQRSPPRAAVLGGMGEKNLYRFDLTFTPESPWVGQFFTIETRIREVRTGLPLSGADFDLDANMPEHGHGMTTVPRHDERNPGDYVSEGLKFHMPGSWAITARASHAHQNDRITLRFDQPPRYR